MKEEIIHWPEMRIFTKGPKILKLPRKLYKLMEYFMANPNRIIDIEELEDTVWYDSNITSNTIASHISKLRKLLNKNFDMECIETSHGFGYIFKI